MAPKKRKRYHFRRRLLMSVTLGAFLGMHGAISNQLLAKISARRAHMAATCSNIRPNSANFGHDNGAFLNLAKIRRSLMPRPPRPVVFLNKKTLFFFFKKTTGRGGRGYTPYRKTLGFPKENSLREDVW